MSPRLRRVLAYLFALVPAGALLIAGILKGADPVLFAEQIGAHGLTPASWSPALAHLLIAVELVVGLALFLWVSPRLSLMLAAGLLVFFMVATAAAWALGHSEACGCFGRLASRGPASVILEDVLFLAAAAVSFLLLRGSPVRVPIPRRAIFLVLSVAAIAYTAAGKSLPLDGFVTGVKPGRDLSDLSIDGLRFPLDRGRVLLVFLDPSSTEAVESIDGLKEIAGTRKGTKIALIIRGTGKEAAAWRLEHLPPFPVAHASHRVLSQYMRDVPTSFLLDDGSVVGITWGGVAGPGDIPPGQPK